MKTIITIALLLALCAPVRAECPDRIIIYCPKCQSENVETRIIEGERVERKSIDELPVGLNCLKHAVVSYCTFEAKCLKCGYSRQYRGTCL